MKTKYMVFASKTKCELYFDAKIDKRVADYKYLGNIISETTNILTYGTEVCGGKYKR